MADLRQITALIQNSTVLKNDYKTKLLAWLAKLNGAELEMLLRLFSHAAEEEQKIRAQCAQEKQAILRKYVNVFEQDIKEAKKTIVLAAEKATQAQEKQEEEALLQGV